MEAEFEALKVLLDEKNVTYSVFTHEKVFTSEEAARVRGVPLSSGVKSMVVKSSERNTEGVSVGSGFFLVLVPGDRKIDFSKLNRARSLASPEEVLRITGCEVGSVHPFGLLFGLRVFMDRRILDNKIVNFNPGLHDLSISMDPKDLVDIIHPEIGDYSK